VRHLEAGQYSLVKFVPDRVRFEPINIGVVLEHDRGVVTRMADDVDPRVRYADPYADLQSLREFLGTFNATVYLGRGRDASVLSWLRDADLPNIYFSAPLDVDLTTDTPENVAAILFGRLVQRSFAKPPDMAPVPSRTAALRALREAFKAEGVLDSRVESSVLVAGVSGVEWNIDFRYATDRVNLVQTVSTNLREDIRRKEHAFEAFAALVDTAQSGGVEGVLAADGRPEENPLSAQLALLSAGHGFRLIAGRRSFIDLARDVRRGASPTAAKTTAPAEGELPLSSR
jgi:hypothetical protein